MDVNKTGGTGGSDATTSGGIGVEQWYPVNALTPPSNATRLAAAADEAEDKEGEKAEEKGCGCGSGHEEDEEEKGKEQGKGEED